MLMEHSARVFLNDVFSTTDGREVVLVTTALHLASLHEPAHVVERLLLDGTIAIEH